MYSMSQTLSEILKDPARLEAIRRIALADASAEAAFDRLAKFATRVVGPTRGTSRSSTRTSALRVRRSDLSP